MQRSVDRTLISITPALGLDETLKRSTLPSKNSVTMRMDPELLYAEVPPGYRGYVLSFHGSAKTTKNGGYDSFLWILWKLPFWDIEIAASAHLPSTTVNLAEYTGMNNGVVAALQRGVSDIIIVGDARLAIQQSMGVIACKKDVLSVELARHKELIKTLNSVATRILERKAKLRALNKNPEKLYTSRDSADTIGNSAATIGNSADTSWNSADAAEEPKATMATCSRARRVHFDNEERENPPLEAIDEGLEEVSEAPSRPRARRRTSGNKVEFEGAQLRTSKRIPEFPAELGEKKYP
ncbi:unnamed protein product [Phytophthora fragariaefolia]|uniref:Unnamed protein product n=1 Tax=Phytophthora fragariaefolia TaxID=1490495 RepID=A0A9W7DB34_9STRA|nr:unnamed protein product [Phytophthora fragariaefolia]